MKFQESPKDYKDNEGRGAEPENGKKVSFVDVPDYATADPELRELMDAHIETINLEDFQKVTEYGSEELSRLSSVANDVRGTMDSSEELLETFDEAQEMVASIDISGLGSKALNAGAKGMQWAKKNPGTAIATVAASTVLGPLALVGVPFAKNKMDSMKQKRDGSDIAATLAANIQKTDEVFASLLDAKRGIDSTVSDLNKLGASRVESYKVVSILLGAGLEKLRRADEEIIPELQKEVTSDPDNLELAYTLENIVMGRDTLDGHITNIATGRAVSQATAGLLSSAKTAFHNAASKINTHLTVSKPQWDAQAAEAGILLTAQKVTEIITDTDEHGNRMLEGTAQMGARVSQLMNESAKKGSFDHTKVVAVMDQVSRTIAEDAKQIGQRREAMAKTRLLIATKEKAFTDKVKALEISAQEGRLKLAAPQKKSLPKPSL